MTKLFRAITSQHWSRIHTLGGGGENDDLNNKRQEKARPSETFGDGIIAV